MSNNSETRSRFLKRAAQRVGAVLQAMESGPLAALDDRLHRLETRLAHLESRRASPNEAGLARLPRGVN
jgi:hypothetical protein